MVMTAEMSAEENTFSRRDAEDRDTRLALYTRPNGIRRAFTL